MNRYFIKKSLYSIILLFIALNSYGQRAFSIDSVVINRIQTLFFLEKYKDCIDSCEKYVIGYSHLGFKRHPYRDWVKHHRYYKPWYVEDVATVMFLGCSAAYKYSLSNSDNHTLYLGYIWARACVAIYDDCLHEWTPKEGSPIDDWREYMLYAKRSLIATQVGEHFLTGYGYDRWSKREAKKFDKKYDRVHDLLYKNIVGKDAVFSDYPILQYEAFKVISDQSLRKKQIKVLRDELKKRMDAFERMIQVCQQNNVSNYEIQIELNLLISILTTTVVDKEICKKAGSDYMRFCMEKLIKLQDISYSLNGSVRYSQSPSYTLRDIQNSLEETDCAILHFEAPIASDFYYFQDDLGTRYRNYVLIIRKNQETPDLWTRYINDNVVNFLSEFRKAYPKATRFYYVGTPRMSFIDIAGNDSSIVRLHSLSQLLQERNSKVAGSEITFIGDLDYTKVGEVKVGEVSTTDSARKGGVFGQLIGSKKELDYIKTLFSNVRFICGDEASKNVVANEISRNNGIVHISTHGELFSPSDDFTIEELILRKDVMEKSCLILSGYNDTPQSSQCYMSGSDVLKIKRINSEVVFLDACMSGKGAVNISGAVGIAEAFHLIGAKNVICYLESVKDYVATEFSNRFYLELSKGASYHEAFFRAKKSINQDIKVILWE